MRAELDELGCALLPQLLTAAQCKELAALYDDHERFRSTVNMARHRFGEGEYRYFRRPYPSPIEALKQQLESADRSSELLLGKQAEPPGFDEQFLARIQAYTAGYDRDFPLIPGLSTALGAQVTFYGKPDFLTPIYGQHPVGVILFLRVRPRGNAHSH